MTDVDTNHQHYTLRDLLRRYRELDSIGDTTALLDTAADVVAAAEVLDRQLSAGAHLPEAWRWERHTRGMSARGRSLYEHGSTKAALKPPSPCIVHTGWDIHPEAGRLTDENHGCTHQLYTCTNCEDTFDCPEGTSAPETPYPADEFWTGHHQMEAITGILRIRMMSDNQVLRLMCDTEHHCTPEHRTVMGLSLLGTMQSSWPPFIAAQVAHSRGLIGDDEYERRTA